MGGSNDTKEDHGSTGHPPSHGREAADGGHTGHGAASALALLHSQRQDRHQESEPEDAAGVHGQ